MAIYPKKKFRRAAKKYRDEREGGKADIKGLTLFVKAQAIFVKNLFP